MRILWQRVRVHAAFNPRLRRFTETSQFNPSRGLRMLSNPFENVLRVADHTFDVTVRGNVCGFETLQSANSIVPPLAVAKFVDNGGPYRGLNRSTFR